jgi:hypothetical protein
LHGPRQHILIRAKRIVRDRFYGTYAVFLIIEDKRVSRYVRERVKEGFASSPCRDIDACISLNAVILLVGLVYVESYGKP